MCFTWVPKHASTMIAHKFASFGAVHNADLPNIFCKYRIIDGHGKYSGATGSGACMPGGNITTDGNNSKFSWKGEWVLP